MTNTEPLDLDAVHDHGSEEGAGLACRESVIDGRPRGACLSSRRGERLLQTAEAMDALPENAAVVDRMGDLWQRHGNRWYAHETQPTFAPRIIRKWGPVRVVFIPEIEETR